MVLLLIGFGGFFGPKTSGLRKGFGAVFFILFFICNLLKKEKTDEEIRESTPPARKLARPQNARDHRAVIA
jgi:hypothetical protein